MIFRLSEGTLEGAAMQTWTPPGLLCLVAGVLSCVGACEWAADDREPTWNAMRTSPVSSGGSSPRAGAGNGCDQFLFHPETPDPSIITCPRDVCGVNGTWLGREVPFRTLNLDGSSNDQGLVIQGFRSESDQPLKVAVEGDSLIGRPKGGGDDLQGTRLKGATLTLSSLSPTKPLSIDFHIDDVSYMPFAAECTPGHICDSRQIPVYRFSATTGGGCPVQVCKPGINPPDTTRNNLQGDAFMFEGDLYDENTFEVSIVKMADNPKKTFNITCVGTAISKLHLLRHTSASQSPYVDVMDRPDKYKREALLRMFTGDYCGLGAPLDPSDPKASSLFTENGIPIWLAFNNGTYQPTRYSGYMPTGTPSIDGRWDHTGATCMTTPRLTFKHPDVSDAIIDACMYAKHPLLHPCSSPGGEYLVSYNPL